MKQKDTPAKGKKRKIRREFIWLTVGLILMAVLLAAYLSATRPRPDLAEEEVPAETGEAEVTETAPSWWVNNCEIDEAGGIPVTHNHVPWDSSRRPGEIREIHYLTIHETDNRSSGADSEAHNSLLTNDTSDITGWHYTVDDHSIYHNLPDNEIGWNAGDNRTELGGNMNGIGIEMCVNLSNDFEATLRNTAELAAKLLVTYDLKVEDVRLHADFMDKVCPHRLISEGRVEEFYQMIRDAYIRLKAEHIRESIGRSFG